MRKYFLNYRSSGYGIKEKK